MRVQTATELAPASLPSPSETRTGSVDPRTPTPAPTVAEPDPKKTEPGMPQQSDLDKITAKMNQIARIFNQSLQFEAVGHHRIVIRIVDTSTGEVIHEIPPEDMVKAFKRMDETLGFLMDHKI